jgi:predicted RND superfamily exporter protein
VAITAEAASSSDGAAVLEEVERIVSSLGPEGWKVEITGPLRVHLDMVNEVQTTQLRSFVTALIAVLALVCVFLRSLPWALAAMVPTLLPVVTTLGAMGYWGIRLDMGTAMVAAVVLGIAVDDTVHLLVQIRRHRAAGEGADRAVEAAVAHVGRAVVTTSIALALGFFVLTLSSWESVASFGVLSGLAILGAMVSDLVVLPALVSAVVDHDSPTSQALLRCSVRE